MNVTAEVIREEIIRKLIQTGKFDRKYAYISERSGYHCEYCQRDLLAPEAIGMWCIEHIVPRRLGGSDEQDNLAIACVVCNKLKGDWDPGNNGANNTRESRITAANVHINDNRTKEEQHLRLIREIINYQFRAQ